MRREELRARVRAVAAALRDGEARRKRVAEMVAALRGRREQLVWAALALGVLVMVLHWR